MKISNDTIDYVTSYRHKKVLCIKDLFDELTNTNKTLIAEKGKYYKITGIATYHHGITFRMLLGIRDSFLSSLFYEHFELKTKEEVRKMKIKKILKD